MQSDQITATFENDCTQMERLEFQSIKNPEVISGNQMFITFFCFNLTVYFRSSWMTSWKITFWTIWTMDNGLVFHMT